MFELIFAVFANQGETAKFYTLNDPYHVEALRGGGYVGSVASILESKSAKKVQNPTSAKIATLKNFPVYSVIK